MADPSLEPALPVTYFADTFAPSAIGIRSILTDQLDWQRRGSTPRSEYYCNQFPVPYTYGRGRGVREYAPQPWHPLIVVVRDLVEKATGSTFDVCFLNRYHDQSDHLGWHADDSPEMDDARPIAIVSFGVERDILFRPVTRTFRCDQCGLEACDIPPETPRFPNHKMSCYTGTYAPATAPASARVEKITLGDGSLCVMAPGMQDAWQHRIPKASFKCGERVSLTFRGYVTT